MARHYAGTRWPANPRELGEALADSSRFRELFPDSAPGAWSDFSNAYAESSPVVAERMALAQQEALQGVATAASPRVPLGGKPQGGLRWKPPVGTVLDELIAGQPKPWQSFLKAINPRNDDEQHGRLRSQMQTAILNSAAMSERVPSSGGFLVPEVLRDEILMQTLEQSVVRPLARVVPMDSLRVPLPAIDDTSHESTVYGGVAGYWTAEGAALTASAPKWDRVELEARKLTAYTTIPNELLEDSVTPLDQWFGTFFPRALAWFEDIAFISGNGVGEPQGFLNSPAAVVVDVTTQYTISFPDIVNVFARIYPPCLTSPGLRWLVSPDSRAQLLTMSYSASQAVSPPPWLSSMQAFDEPTPKLFGIDVIVSEKMPSSLSGNTTVAGAVALVDFGQYLLGDRQSMQIAVSDEYLFGSDLVAYRVIERLDGRIWQQTPITPANGSSQTLSPVVLLNTAAS